MPYQAVMQYHDLRNQNRFNLPNQNGSHLPTQNGCVFTFAEPKRQRLQHAEPKRQSLSIPTCQPKTAPGRSLCHDRYAIPIRYAAAPTRRTCLFFGVCASAQRSASRLRSLLYSFPARSSRPPSSCKVCIFPQTKRSLRSEWGSYFLSIELPLYFRICCRGLLA